MKKLTALLLLSTLPFAATAAQGEVCTTMPVMPGQQPTITATLELNNKTLFECPSLGKVSVPQIYEKGWRIVYVAPMMTHSSELGAEIAKKPAGSRLETSGMGMIPHMALKAIIEKI